MNRRIAHEGSSGKPPSLAEAPEPLESRRQRLVALGKAEADDPLVAPVAEKGRQGIAATPTSRVSQSDKFGVGRSEMARSGRSGNRCRCRARLEAVPASPARKKSRFLAW